MTNASSPPLNMTRQGLNRLHKWKVRFTRRLRAPTAEAATTLAPSRVPDL